MRIEIWKDIKGYEGLYQISNHGRVRSLDRVVYQKNKSGGLSKHIYKGQILKSRENRNGYYTIGLTKDRYQKHFSVHRLVGEHFLEGRENKNYINHIDCDKSNNHASNLEWCSQSENIQYAYDIGTKRPPHMRRVGQYDDNGNLISIWESESEAGRALGIQQSNIYKVCRGKRKKTGGFNWKYIE